MDLKKASKFIDSQIDEFERSVYMFETIVRPRYEADKKILSGLREQSLKLGTIADRVAAGEQVTRQELIDCVPPQFMSGSQ